MLGLPFCMVHYKQEHSKYHVMSQIVLLINLNECSLTVTIARLFRKQHKKLPAGSCKKYVQR